MDFLVFGGTENVLAELEESRVFSLYCLVEYLEEVFRREVLYIALISSEIDGKRQQLDCADVGMREEDQLHHVVHTVCICQGVANAPLR